MTKRFFFTILFNKIDVLLVYELAVMSEWVELTEYESKDFGVYRRIRAKSKHSADYKLVPKDKRKNEQHLNLGLAKEVLGYIESQINNLPLLENKDEAVLGERDRYEQLLDFTNVVLKQYQVFQRTGDGEDLDKIINEWLYFFEAFYESDNDALRKRFFKHLIAKNTGRQEKRLVARSKRDSISLQHRKSFKEPEHVEAASDIKAKTPYQQVVALRREKQPKLAKYNIRYDRADRTLFLEPKLINEIQIRFGDFRFIKIYLSKPRVSKNLQANEIDLCKKHSELADKIIAKHQLSQIDRDFVDLWLDLLKLWEDNKPRYRMFEKDYQNNSKTYRKG